MKYEVVWEDNARSEVAAEFASGSDKVAIIDAAYQIDRALESAPIGNGERRPTERLRSSRSD